MPTTYEELDRKYRAARAQLTTLQAKLEAAEKDAGRYRWMCSHKTYPSPSLWDKGIGFATPRLSEKIAFSDKQEVDAAIDAALAQNGKESFDQREWKENNLPVAERNRAKE